VFKRLLNAMQSTLKFPYVDFNSSTQSLKDFPVKMCISLPEELVNPDIRALKTLDFDTYIEEQTALPSSQKNMLKAIINKLLPKKIKQDREGFVHAYSTLLQSFVEDIDPELFCEHNLARALKEQKASLSDKKLSLKLIGDIKSTEVLLLNQYIITGGITPLRNLTLPATNYDIVQSFKQGSLTSYEITYKHPIDNVSLDNFKDSNLKHINTYTTPQDFLDLKQSLASYLDEFGLHIRVMDIGFYTTYKLNIFDSEGKLVNGNADPNIKEFHLLRFEKLSPLNNDKETKEFLEKHLEEDTNEYMISDLDGYLKGNSVIPGSGLEV
jgi:hypothetical protein